MKLSDRSHLMGLLDLHVNLTQMICGWVGGRDITLVEFAQAYAAAAHSEIEDDMLGVRPRTSESEEDKEAAFQGYARYVEIVFDWDGIEAGRASGL